VLAALGNHLWQSTLFAIAVALLIRLFRHYCAAARHGLWFSALLKFAIPFAWLWALGRDVGASVAFPGIASASATPAWSALLGGAVQPLTSTAASATHGVDFTGIALALWLCGVSVVLGIATVRWRQIHRALHAAQPFTGEAPGSRPIPVKSSKTRMEPSVIGIRRPVLLLPHGITERLSPEQLQAVIEHELCHVRRRDNLTGAIQLIIQAAFWFYPPVWWIGARVLEERERACDESVLEAGCDSGTYAEGLLNVCALYLTSSLDCTAGVTGAALKRRIEAIVQHRSLSPVHSGLKALLILGATLAVVLPIAAGVLRTPLARAQAGSTVEFDLTGVTSDSPQTKLLRRHIEAWQRYDQPEFEDSDPAIAEAVRTRWAGAHEKFFRLGAPQSITYTGVGPAGGHVYRVQFAQSTYQFLLKLNSQGKIASLSFRRRIPPAEIANTIRHYDIPAGEARRGLNEFSRQGSVPMLFNFAELAGLTTPRLLGDYTVNQALRQFLNGLPLHASWVDGDVIALTRIDATAESVRPVPAEKAALAEPLLILHGDTLAHTVAQFNRYNRRQMVIDDPRIADIRIGGAFVKTDPDSFFYALSTAFGIQARIEGQTADPGSGTFHLTRASSIR
jgi:beta-lactamase regulating signal transducer with metallopeptidase domain